MADFIDYYKEFNLDRNSSCNDLMHKISNYLNQAARSNHADAQRTAHLEQALQCFQTPESKKKYDAELDRASRTPEDDLIDVIASVKRCAQQNDMEQALFEMDDAENSAQKRFDAIGFENISDDTVCDMGIAELMLGRPEKADSAARNVRARNKEFPGAYYILGMVAKANGDMSTAETEWEKSLELGRTGKYTKRFIPLAIAELVELELDRNAMDEQQLENAEKRERYRSVLSEMEERLSEAFAVDRDNATANELSRRISSEREKSDRAQIKEASTYLEFYREQFKQIKRTNEELKSATVRAECRTQLEKLAAHVESAQVLMEGGGGCPDGALAESIKRELAKVDAMSSDIKEKQSWLAACATEADSLLSAGNTSALCDVMEHKVAPIIQSIGKGNVTSDQLICFTRCALAVHMNEEAADYADCLCDRGDFREEASVCRGDALRADNELEDAMYCYDQATWSTDDKIAARAYRGKALCLIALKRPSDERLYELSACNSYSETLEGADQLWREAFGRDRQHPEGRKLRSLINEELRRLEKFQQAIEERQRQQAAAEAAEQQRRAALEAERQRQEELDRQARIKAENEKRQKEAILKIVGAVIIVVIVAFVLFNFILPNLTTILGAVVVIAIVAFFLWPSDK